MARSDNNLSAVFTDTANAIRSKTGTSSAICPRDFADQITNIPTGGGNNEEALDLLNGNLGDYVLPSKIGTPGYPLRDGAFEEEHELHSIDLKNQLFVPSRCFSSCTNLEYASGSNVIWMGDNAFRNCSNLKSVNFPNLLCFSFYYSLSSCYWFSNCKELSEITLNNLVALGNAFYSCSKLNYVEMNNLVHVSGGNNFGSCIFSSIELPNLIAQESMSAFYHCDNLENVSFPKLVKANYMFSWCSKLSNVYMPNCYFGSYSFPISNSANIVIPNEIETIITGFMYNQQNITSISFPIAAVYGGNNLFYSCANLKEATLAAYGQTNDSPFGNSCFANCTSLESLYILDAGSRGNLRNVNAFSNTPMSNDALLGQYGSIYVPSSWVASYKASTNWITYSDRITALPSEFDSKYVYAEEYYSKQTLLSYPSEKLNVDYVLPYAFFSCSQMAVPLLELTNCKGIGIAAFMQCQKISSLSLPNCKVINTSAFATCTGLSKLYAPNVICINSNAFRQINNLSIIDIPECIYLGEYCFGYGSTNDVYFNAPKLEFLGIGALDSKKFSYFNAPNIKYMDCTIQSPTIEHFEFSQLKGGNFKINYCSELKTLSLPYMTWAENYGFAGNSKLSSIYCPNLLRIGVSAFQGCSSLTTFDFNNILTISAYAFNRTGLLKIYAPNIDRIASSCFSEITNLSKAFFKMVYGISQGAFAFCSSLESLYLQAKGMCSLESTSVFDRTPISASSYIGRFGSIFVPSVLLSKYQNDSVWSYFSERLVGLTDEQFQDVIDHWND